MFAELIATAVLQFADAVQILLLLTRASIRVRKNLNTTSACPYVSDKVCDKPIWVEEHGGGALILNWTFSMSYFSPAF